ncbi:MAG: glycerol-3-phosphate 1-O-acyltransferase PlsY [Acidobacteria bacterium]|nr:glycerol-3-phosphate 1-O-acyltransferase PlsY [Acidobacteriota bacterium]
MSPFLILLADYLIGGVPFGYLIVKLTTGQDVRASGSGNIGATNVLRTTGRAAGVLTLALDVLKGLFAVWLMARFTSDSPLWTSLAALAVMAGHAFPLFLGFKGGKAVASFIGAFLYVAPLPLFAVLLVFVVVVAVSKYISLGSVIAAGVFPLGVWLIMHPPAPVWIAATVAGAFIVYRHRANIERIREGNENVFSFKGKKAR